MADLRDELANGGKGSVAPGRSLYAVARSRLNWSSAKGATNVLLDQPHDLLKPAMMAGGPSPYLP